MLLRIEHETVLSYSEPVFEHVFEVRMAPVSNDDQTSLGYRLQVSPVAPTTPYRDGHGNRVELITLLPPCRKIVVRATSFVRTHRREAITRLNGTKLSSALFSADCPVETLDYLGHSQLADGGKWLDNVSANLSVSPETTLADLIDQMFAAISSSVRYEKSSTSAGTKASEAMAMGCGVCQDFSHIFIALCRKIGLPARYVSGYIHEPGEIATHAWVQIWGGSHVGWLDIDPTHRSYVGDDHVQVGFGCDYADVPPNRGSWRGQAEENIQVSVRVEPVSRLPADWIDSESLPFKGFSAESGTLGLRGTGRLANRHYQKILYRQQQQQQQQ